ncbi:hypothetical protein SDD30_16775 [Moorella naiadis]|uniref:aspartate racemase/maleate isomerase family protein n=1 Tax=Moorella naiadis (nom. illeg.) TaxID=3093670 RepID=UPI003D9CB824
MLTALIIRSSENVTIVGDLERYYPDVRWIDVIMPFLPGRGETQEERHQILTFLTAMRNKYPEINFVLYARSYGVFSEEGRAAISSIFSVPVITATGAIISKLRTLKANKLYVITPYGQTRHGYELKWLNEYGFEIIASSCLGHDAGEEILAIKTEEVVAALKLTNSLKSRLDGIYVACTFLRTLTMNEELQQVASVPVVTATGSMLWELDQLRNAL